MNPIQHIINKVKTTTSEEQAPALSLLQKLVEDCAQAQASLATLGEDEARHKQEARVSNERIASIESNDQDNIDVLARNLAEERAKADIISKRLRVVEEKIKSEQSDYRLLQWKKNQEAFRLAANLGAYLYNSKLRALEAEWKSWFPQNLLNISGIHLFCRRTIAALAACDPMVSKFSKTKLGYDNDPVYLPFSPDEITDAICTELLTCGPDVELAEQWRREREQGLHADTIQKEPWMRVDLMGS